MKNLSVQIEVDSNLYLKKPDTSDLGRSIISTSIEMINTMGFESFTFKKLGASIQSPESSIYRYFKSKHQLLVYLTSWYWSWMEYKLFIATSNIKSPLERLKKSIDLLTKPVLEDNDFTYINEVLLSEIIFSESIKTYHTTNVDEQNRKGWFKAYKKVVERVSSIVLEINPTFKYPHMLISTVIEGAHQQKYFAEHIPELTDIKQGENLISEFYIKMVISVLEV